MVYLFRQMLPIHSNDDPNKEYTAKPGCDKIKEYFLQEAYERQGF
jgi:hypothetical protein